MRTRPGRSAKTTRTSISVVTASLTTTHQCRNSPHGVNSEFRTPTIHTTKLSGMKTQRPISEIAG